MCYNSRNGSQIPSRHHKLPLTTNLPLLAFLHENAGLFPPEGPYRTDELEALKRNSMATKATPKAAKAPKYVDVFGTKNADGAG